MLGLGGASAVSAAGLELRLDAPVAKDYGSGKISYALTNTSGATLHVLRWQTPVGGMTGRLFEVTRNGEKVDYVGPMFKRAEPTAADYVELKAGETLATEIDLTAYYDMRAGGQFEVRYARDARDVVKEVNATAKSGVSAGYLDFDRKGVATIYVDAAVDAFDDVDFKAGAGVRAATNSFVGCTTTRQNQIASARTGATSYANNSKSYLTAGTQGSRYTWWFGAYNSSRYTTARNHFNSIHSALSSQPFTFRCDCNDSAYAYVYPNQPYTVYLCNAFWSAPATGTDSKAGTIVHETSHFNVVAGTDDWAYGQSAAHSLATSNPSRAVDNADSHEYFAENTPARN
jgi:peptidyl-Lys metalloendopeptidase